MQKSILALAGAATCVFTASLAQAQTFPNYTPNPAPWVGGTSGPTSSGSVNLNTDYLIVNRVQPVSGLGQSLTQYGLLPMSSFAGAADLSATNANLATTNANLATTNTNLATTNANLATANQNLATTNQNLLGLQNYAIGVRNLVLSVRKEARQGTASAMALSTAPMPSAPGRTSWTVNAAEFNSEPGWGGSVAHRLNTSVPFAVTAGFAFSGANSGARVGLSGEF
jgi:hypothetical protein